MIRQSLGVRRNCHGQSRDASRLFRQLVHLPLSSASRSGVGVLYLIDHGPWQYPLIQRYVHHSAEQVVVVLFFCCLAGVARASCSSISMKERYAQAKQLLPGWDVGKP